MSGHNASISFSVNSPNLSVDPIYKVRMKTRCYPGNTADDIEKRLWEELSYNDFEWLREQLNNLPRWFLGKINNVIFIQRLYKCIWWTTI